MTPAETERETPPMNDQDRAILQGLVTVAWADGRLESSELGLLDALLGAFGASESEASDLRAWASTPRTLADLPLTELSAGDRRVLLQHAVLLSFVDGEQAAVERAHLGELARALRIPEDETQALLQSGDERARRLLPLLRGQA